MKLKDLYEGGQALKGANVIRVNREDVPATVRHVSKISGIPIEDLHLLGSTGKNPTSGDIDLGIDIKKYNPEQLHTKMVSSLGSSRSTYNKGTKIGSYVVDIAGDPKKGFVQVDFMYVPSTEWAKFSYHSSGEKSKYKGVIRTVLLRSIASSLDEKDTDMFVYDAQTNDLMIRVGRTMDMNTGLRRIVQLRPKRKDGTGYLKTMKTVNMDELEAAYPALNFNKLKNVAVIDKPEDALKVMFGTNVKPSDVETAEQIMKIIKNFPADRRDRVLKKTRETFSSKGYLTDDQIKELFGDLA